MTKGHKGQHWVPRSYLEAWCDPDMLEGQEPYIWRFTRDGSASKRKAPHNIFKETDLYTIRLNDGTRNLAIEHGLAGLESRFCDVRDDKLLQTAPLDGDDRLITCAFTAAMLLRTPAIRNHWQRQLQGIVDVGEQMRQVVESAPPEEWDRFTTRLPSDKPGMSIDDVKKLAEQPLQLVLIPQIPAITEWFLRVNLLVLRATDDVGFITSDAPCVVFDPEAYKQPYGLRNPGLGVTTVEITLPIAPTRLLLFSWHDGRGYADVHEPIGLDEVNRRTRIHCDEHFVVRRNVVRPVWLEVRRLPNEVGQPESGADRSTE